MKMKEIREKNEAELKKLGQNYKEKLRSLRFKVAQKQVKDVRELRDVRKDLARILTETNRRQRAKKQVKK